MSTFRCVCPDDDAQNLYGEKRDNKFSFKSVGIQAQGRTTILKLNYRNTEQVLKVAYEFAREVITPTTGDDDQVVLVACEKATALQPKRQNIDLWISRSNVLMQQQKYAQAIASYDQVLKREQKNSFALTQRCEALSILGNNSDAIAYCEEALHVDGNWGNITPATAWFNRGVVLRKLTRSEEALTSFERAINLNTHYSVALAKQCGTLIDLQRYQEAIKACDLAIQTSTY